jgi:hypothetical protein
LVLEVVTHLTLFEHTDREIDQLVYELYGLSDREIALVEESTRND